MTVVNLPYEYGTVSQGLTFQLMFADEHPTEGKYGGWPLSYLSDRIGRYPEESDDSWSILAIIGNVFAATLLAVVVVGAYERRRRQDTSRWQLSIGDLCFLMLAVCCVFGTWNMMARRYLTQQEAIQEIRISGGYVTTHIVLPKVVIGPSEASPIRHRFHAWLVQQLWNYEQPTAARVAELNEEAIEALHRLPEIRTLVVYDQTVTDEALAKVESFRSLERLQIGGEHLTAACVLSIQRLRSLRYLRIRDAPLSDDAISKLIALPNLVSLDVEGTRLTDAGLVGIAQCRRLRELNIARTNISAEGLRFLDGHPKLTRLWLASEASTPESPGIRRIKLRDLPRLESIHLPSELNWLELRNLPALVQMPSAWDPNDLVGMHAMYRNSGMFFLTNPPFPQPIQYGIDARHVSLRDLPALTTLKLNRQHLESLEVDVSSLQYLSMNVTHLTQLFGYSQATRFRDTSTPKYDIDDQFSELIGRNLGLQTLHLTDASLTHQGWAQLSSLEQLKVLDLSGSNITDADLGAFANTSQLETFKLNETQVSDDGWAKLPRFPELQHLGLSNTEITRLTLEALPKLDALEIERTPLESLRLVDLPMLTLSVTLAGSGPMTIELSNLPAFESFNAQHQCIDRMILRELPALNHLELTGSTVNDSMLSNVGDFASLKLLLVGETEITDATLSRIGELANLDRLDVSETPITDKGLASLSDKLPLTILNLTGTKVTDDGLRHLPRLQQLRQVLLGRTEVHGPGLQHLSRLGGLQTLSLEETKVTSDSLKHLRGVGQLNWLRLSDTRIDDLCFQHINQLPALVWLFLDRTSVTDQGIATFTMPRRLKVLDVSDSSVSAYWVSSTSESRRDVKISW
ncbi:MAG: hypothetical protein H8E66_12820 [Planctomycetes bacterium]|nr:hypothetical protein [Planctomycetota bacterium]